MMGSMEGNKFREIWELRGVCVCGWVGGGIVPINETLSTLPSSCALQPPIHTQGATLKGERNDFLFSPGCSSKPSFFNELGLRLLKTTLEQK